MSEMLNGNVGESYVIKYTLMKHNRKKQTMLTSLSYF